MILIPELRRVVILVPRTGSGGLYRAILAAYPRAIMPYRHMEADGVPQGYDTWHKIGVVREPLARLWSLYNHLKAIGASPYAATWPKWAEAMGASVDRPFDDWLLHNQTVFTSGYYTGGDGAYEPMYAVRYPMPENRKSQRIFLRPDLGTEIVPFDDLAALGAALGIALGRANSSGNAPAPSISNAAVNHMRRYFAWDMEAAGCAHHPIQQATPAERDDAAYDAVRQAVDRRTKAPQWRIPA
jgi:hypothetical protein